MIEIEICTQFDITNTDVKHYFKPAELPFTTKNGDRVVDEKTWQKARNQQRNWETINQLISLRTLPEQVSSPVIEIKNNKTFWCFRFSVNSVEQLETEENTLNLIKKDCENVPLITGLNEKDTEISTLCLDDKQCNIWFKMISTTN